MATTDLSSSTIRSPVIPFDPEFVQFNVTGLLINGVNTFRFTGHSVSTGDYVIGQVTLRYDSAQQVPEPASLAFGLVALAGAGIRRRYLCK